jgi:hypothetical protein
MSHDHRGQPAGPRFPRRVRVDWEPRKRRRVEKPRRVDVERREDEMAGEREE